ncbi:MAG: hypothetical protein IT364_16675 [Candidatus Hydrogenedentes bacterium]|nr:hypothetical protein [Candidatus Hydrogenedentota bacterium]
MSLFDHIFHHPYQYSGAVIAKLSVCTATLMWAALVLFYPNATANNPNYQHMLRLLPDEDLWAGVLGTLALLLLLRIILCLRPHRIGVAGYFVLGLFWMYLWLGLVLSPRVWPTGTAAGTVVAALALYAFIANPKRGSPPGYGDAL